MSAESTRSGRRRRPAVVPAASLALAASICAGCGGTSSGSSSTKSAAAIVHRTTTPTSPNEVATFTAHAGLGFGTFHRYVYTPSISGGLREPRARARASAASAAAAHDVARAKQDAQQGTALRKLYGPLAALVPMLQSLSRGLTHGHSERAAVKTTNAAISDLERMAAGAGIPITEHAAPVAP